MLEFDKAAVFAVILAALALILLYLAPANTTCVYLSFFVLLVTFSVGIVERVRTRHKLEPASLNMFPVLGFFGWALIVLESFHSQLFLLFLGMSFVILSTTAIIVFLPHQTSKKAKS